MIGLNRLKMKGEFLTNRFTGVFIICLGFVLLASDAWARAGGGRNSGGGILYVILLPFLIVYAWYVNRRINKKKQEADLLLGKISKQDLAWDESHLEKIVRKTFYEIENAWCKQDLAKLQQFLHQDLYSEWKSQIDRMRSNEQWNIMENLLLKNTRIVEVKNYRDDEKDSFTVCIDASATD